MATAELTANDIKKLVKHIKDGDHSVLTKNIPASIYGKLDTAARYNIETVVVDPYELLATCEIVLPAYIPVELLEQLPDDVKALLPKSAFEQPRPVMAEEGDFVYEYEDDEDDQHEVAVTEIVSAANGEMSIHEKAAALRKEGKKILTLRIKQQWFDEIIAGTKKQESREITPTTEKKYIELDKDGYAIEDKARPVFIYDYIPAEIKEEGGKRITNVNDDDEEPDWVEILTDEEGDFVKVTNTDGGINEIPVVNDKNGNPHFRVVDNVLFCSTPKQYDYLYLYIGNAPDCDKAIVEVTHTNTQFFVEENEDPKTGFVYSKPLWYVTGKDEDGNDLRYFVEQVVYDLGNVIEKELKQK